MNGTPTLLRVKRRITEDPTEILLLSAKRRKTDSVGDEGNSVQILKLAGRVEQADLHESLSKIINKRDVPNFAELKEKYKKSRRDRTTVSDRSKVKDKEREEERFRVVNVTRAIKIDELEAWPEDGKDLSPGSEQSSMFHLYDIIKDEGLPESQPPAEKLSCNGVEMIREYRSEKPDNYVYDVYYAEGGEGLADFDDSLLDGLVSLQPFNTGLDLMYEEYRSEPNEVEFEDDNDSNDEDNVRNEYPEDEDEEEDIYEDSYGDYTDELGIRMGRIRMQADEEADLSTDDEDEKEEGLTFSRSMEEVADLHGSSYARYKKRMMKELRDDELLDEDSEDESDDDHIGCYEDF